MERGLTRLPNQQRGRRPRIQPLGAAPAASLHPGSTVLRSSRRSAGLHRTVERLPLGPGDDVERAMDGLRATGIATSRDDVELAACAAAGAVYIEP